MSAARRRTACRSVSVKRTHNRIPPFLFKTKRNKRRTSPSFRLLPIISFQEEPDEPPKVAQPTANEWRRQNTAPPIDSPPQLLRPTLRLFKFPPGRHFDAIRLIDSSSRPSNEWQVPPGGLGDITWPDGAGDTKPFFCCSPANDKLHHPAPPTPVPKWQASRDPLTVVPHLSVSPKRADVNGSASKAHVIISHDNVDRLKLDFKSRLKVEEAPPVAVQVPPGGLETRTTWHNDWNGDVDLETVDASMYKHANHRMQMSPVAL